MKRTINGEEVDISPWASMATELIDPYEQFRDFRYEEFIDTKAHSRNGGWGLNWQHCAHTVTFPSHSFEQYYQSIRRFWRFGQKHPVTVDIVTSEGEQSVLTNMQRKAKAADRMFAALVEQMNAGAAVRRSQNFEKKEEMPSWL